MKYMLTWTERSQGSPIEYENAQKRILEVFTQWKAPANFKIELFVIRVGDWGGYMMLDCDDPTAVHKFCSMLPAFVFEARPVIPIEDAVRVELESIAFRDGLKPRSGRRCNRTDVYDVSTRRRKALIRSRKCTVHLSSGSRERTMQTSTG